MLAAFLPAVSKDLKKWGARPPLAGQPAHTSNLGELAR
jgi:hypothetical protein